MSDEKLDQVIQLLNLILNELKDIRSEVEDVAMNTSGMAKQLRE